MYRLFFLNGKYRGKRLVVQQNTLLIGRGPDCQINLDDDDRVSHHHAVIEVRDNGPVIRDLGAMNKVEVNQRQVVEHRLRHGDRIEIGGTVIEFYRGEKEDPPFQARRSSKLQIVAIAGISLVVLVQVGFVILFPLWQKNETVPAPLPPKEKKVEEPVEVANTEAPRIDASVVTPPLDAVVDTPAVVVDQPVPVASPPSTPSVAPEPPPVAIASEPVKPPEPPPAEPPATVELVDPLAEQAKGKITQAKAEIRKNKLEAADNLLHQAQMLAPKYVPAWQERAALYEKRGMYQESTEQWKQVMSLTGRGADYDKAAAEKKRVEARITKPVAVAPPASPQTIAPAAQPARSLRIESHEPDRLPPSDDYDEMRIIRIVLRTQGQGASMDVSQVRVTVEFFDRVAGSDRIVPTRVLVDTNGLKIQSPWNAGETRSLTASYIVQKGFRDQELRQLGQRRSYEGYRVRVYYRGELQDQQARPRRVMDAR